jgi:hypothetical protein
MGICKHLSEILNTELQRGNRIMSIDDKKWSNAVLVFNLEKEIDKEYIKKHLSLPDCVKYSETKDTHYPFKFKYFCSECKNGITSPRDAK